MYVGLFLDWSFLDSWNLVLNDEILAFEKERERERKKKVYNDIKIRKSR